MASAVLPMPSRHVTPRRATCVIRGAVRPTIIGMPSLLDPLPDEGQQLVDGVAQAYAMTGTWPVWQFVAQHAFGKHGIDAEAALRNLPRWRGVGVSSYQAVRTVPAVAGNSSPSRRVPS